MHLIFKSILLFIALVIFIPSQHFYAQEYDSSLGFRIGLSSGLTGKIFFHRHGAFKTMSAMEGIVSIRYKGFMCTALYENHVGVFKTKGFYLYYGGGAHIGLWDSDQVLWESELTGRNVYTGIDGIIGLEYVIRDIPLSVGLDWKPSFNLYRETNVNIDDIALSVRYLFD